MSGKRLFGLLVVFLFVSHSQAEAQQLDVRYDPSTPGVVARMLRMANVTADDLVYDLGCGDGRIVIAAAREYGARGVGIDIDPVRISEAKDNAKKEVVTGKVRFIEQNLFEADIDKATVVTLFLLPSVNLRLRPKLFRELEPGTRIVSHEHWMGDWKPDQTEDFRADGRSHTVHLWILPANVSGTWEWTGRTDTGKRRYSLGLDQEFQAVYGKLSSDGANITISEMTLEGDRIRFVIEEETGNEKVIRTFDGTADGNSIKGTVESTTDNGVTKKRWRAKRDTATIDPLDK